MKSGNRTVDHRQRRIKGRNGLGLIVQHDGKRFGRRQLINPAVRIKTGFSGRAIVTHRQSLANYRLHGETEFSLVSKYDLTANSLRTGLHDADHYRPDVGNKC